MPSIFRAPQDIRAMDFVIKLRESDPGSTEVKRLVDDYVITPAVERELRESSTT